MSVTQRISLVVAVLGIALLVVAAMGTRAILDGRSDSGDMNDRAVRALALGRLESGVRDLDLVAAMQAFAGRRVALADGTDGVPVDDARGKERIATLAPETDAILALFGRARAAIRRALDEGRDAQRGVLRRVRVMGSLRASFTRANELTARVAAAIEEQSAATGAIAQSVHQAAVSTQDVTSTIVDVSRAANDTGRSAVEIVAAADDLSTQADTLRTRMANFIGAVRKRAA